MSCDLIKKSEKCRLKAYRCPKGILTIGWGNTFYEDGTRVKEGDEITQERADTLLNWYCTTEIKMPLGYYTEGQKTALFSLIYNIGQPAFDGSKLKQHILNKRYSDAMKEWDFGLKDNLNGIVKRRSEELYLFMRDIKK